MNKTGQIKSVTANRGLALVLVLWVLMLLTIMAGSFSLSLKREMDLVRNAKEQAQAKAVAEAGVQLAMMMLSSSRASSQWRGDGTVYEVPFEDATIRVQILDEAGKFDINTVSEDTLERLFLRVGVEEERAKSLTGAVLDWRDEDDLTHNNGAEEDDYRSAGFTYGPRNKSFQSLQELQLVAGMDAKLYEDLEPMITIYTQATGIDPSKASREVLLSLPDMSEETVDTYLDNRLESIIKNTAAPAFPLNVAGSVGGGSTYHVRAEAMLNTGTKANLVVVLGRGAGQSGLPFSYLSWKKSPSVTDSLFAESVIAFPGFQFEWDGENEDAMEDELTNRRENRDTESVFDQNY